MKRLAIPLAILALAGCGQGESDVTTLSAGSEAVVVAPVIDGVECPAYLDDPRSGESVMRLEPGTRVRIGQDSGVYVETDRDLAFRMRGAKTTEEADAIRRRGPLRHVPPDSWSRIRAVRIVVENGPGQGKAGTVARANLRPVK